jgi:hypothetical protein
MKRVLVALMLSLTMAGCALDSQSAPALAGPSELGVSLSLTTSPDAILQDGAAQSVIELVARDGAGQPVAGQTFLVQSRVGSAFNIGTLSASSVTTNGQGRATVVFTAPDLGNGPFAEVAIDFIQLGNNAAHTQVRTVVVRMIQVQ